MKLYGNSPSPFVRHCRIALLEEGLDFEFLPADASVSTKLSPMQRIPFLEYEEEGKTLMLTDSSSILRYIRETAGKTFLPTVQDLNNFCAVNTLIDSQVNLFLLQKEGLGPDSVAYLKRQQNRIQTGLQEFEQSEFESFPPWSEVSLRLSCFLGWVRFRELFSLEPFPKLLSLLEHMDTYAPFQQTAPVDG